MIDTETCPTCGQHLVPPPPCGESNPGLVADVVPMLCTLPLGHLGWHEARPWAGGPPCQWIER